MAQPINYPDWLKWVLEESKFLDWIRRNLEKYPCCCNSASPLLGGYLKNHFGLHCKLIIGEYQSNYHVWLKVTDTLNTYYLDATIQQFGGHHRIHVFVNPEGSPYVEKSRAEIPSIYETIYCQGMSLLDFLKATKKRDIHNWVIYS